ncbi:unnamed protein product [Moneuplotes crassus]|uniref:Uncharacterized protein n=1 Tax=Euplotes crassus TaxID=5936 RepID=A0AAD1YD53_EUPCR|nr:unnamed protein product [Moneuplotes crassus]
MDKYSYEEENLSEELLDEKACILSVNMPNNIDANMSKPLFSSKMRVTKEAKYKSLTSSKYNPSPISKMSVAQEKKYCETFTKASSNNCSDSSFSESCLQRDIKALLRKAIKIRKDSHPSPEVQVSPGDKSIADWKIYAKGVSVTDCQAPSAAN